MVKREMYSDKIIATVGIFVAIVGLIISAISINIWAQNYFSIEKPMEFWKIWTIGFQPLPQPLPPTPTPTPPQTSSQTPSPTQT